MNKGKYVFSQVMTYFPRWIFEAAVEKYSGDFHAKNLTGYSHCQHLPQPVADRDVLQMDQGEPDHQSPLGLLGERCQGPSLGRNQFLSVTRLGESCAQKPADHHRSLKSSWSIAPYQDRRVLRYAFGAVCGQILEVRIPQIVRTK